MNFVFNINVCRACMQNDQSCDLWIDKDILEKFQFTTRLAIKDEDNLPKSLCSRCTTRLKVAYSFIKKAHESENNLKTFLAKINTEFKQVTQGNMSITKTSQEENLTEDALLSLIDNETATDDNIGAILNEKRKKFLTHDNATRKYKMDLKVENLNTAEEILQSNEEDYDKSKQNETIYRLSKDILLVHNNEINNEYENNSHFMEIPIQDDEAATEKYPYNEEVEEELELDKNNRYTSRPMLEVNEESEIRSQSTELAMEDSEENHDNETVVNSQDDNIQYQSIYVEESSVEETNQKNAGEDDDFYINNINGNEKETHENPLQNEVINIQTETAVNFFSKKESMAPRLYCEKCNRDFSTKTNYNRHMVSHKGNKPFPCTECKKCFTQKSALKQHMYTHTGEKPYVCELCNRGFTQCKSLVFHMRRHTGEKPFHCEYCLVTFRQKDALRIHILKHHVDIEQTKDGSIEFTCIICQKKFSTKAEFIIHMKVHTATAEVDNVVEVLRNEKGRPAIKKLKNTRNNVSNLLMSTDAESINAAIVNVSASSAAEPSRAKKFQCRKCFKCFALKKSLVRHMRIHYVNNVDELSECIDCELQFSSAETYQDHLLECHQYACSVCPELVFKTVLDLKMHMFEHDLNQQEHQQ